MKEIAIPQNQTPQTRQMTGGSRLPELRLSKLRGGDIEITGLPMGAVMTIPKEKREELAQFLTEP